MINVVSGWTSVMGAMVHIGGDQCWHEGGRTVDIVRDVVQFSTVSLLPEQGGLY